jgi:hypothetical protein
MSGGRMVWNVAWWQHAAWQHFHARSRLVIQVAALTA